jgi:group I intron endonuclease
LKNRERQHFQELRKNSHKNKHLQNAYNKYGGDNFEFKIILYCEPEELTYYEQKLVDLWNPAYNKCKLCVDSTRGLKMSEEAVRINSESHKGIRVSEETKIKMSLAKKGKPKSELAKMHMRERRYSDEAKLRMSLARTGIKNCRIVKKEIILQIAEMLYNKIPIKTIETMVGASRSTIYKTKNGFYDSIYGIKKIDIKLDRWIPEQKIDKTSPPDEEE